MDKFFDHFSCGDFTNIPDENLKPFDRAQDLIIGLQESVYKDGSIVNLENCLEELCALFEVKYMPGVPMLDNKEHVKQIYTHERALLKNTKIRKNNE